MTRKPPTHLRSVYLYWPVPLRSLYFYIVSLRRRFLSAVVLQLIYYWTWKRNMFSLSLCAHATHLLWTRTLLDFRKMYAILTSKPSSWSLKTFCSRWKDIVMKYVGFIEAARWFSSGILNTESENYPHWSCKKRIFNISPDIFWAYQKKVASDLVRGDG